MGRFVSGGAGGQPRSLRIKVELSDPAIPIPAWARLARLNASGGGGSGGIGASNNGGGGGASAQACGYVIPIPEGATTLSAIIGAGGDSVSGTAETNGLAGGATEISIAGQTFLWLDGGKGGYGAGTYSGGAGGRPVIGTDPAVSPSQLVNAFSESSQFALGLVTGCAGGLGSNVYVGHGAGGYSTLGNGGLGFAAAITAPGVNGNPARGKGAGGSGTRYISGAAVTSGAGEDGAAFIEFLEAVG